MTYSAMYGGRSGRAKGKAPKSKKLKCILCQAKGHDAASCPQIKNDDDHHSKKEHVLKATLMQPTLGFGKTHKTSRKAGTILNMTAMGNGDTNNDGTINGENHNHSDNIYDMFRENNDNNNNNDNNGCVLINEPLVLLDGGCDIGATLDHIATTITNSNLKKAKITYQNTITAITTTTTTTTTTSIPSLPSRPNDQQEVVVISQQQQSNADKNNNNNNNNFIPYGASICRCFIKPDHKKTPLMNNPRIITILEANPHTYFVIGLGPGYFLNGSHDTIDPKHVDGTSPPDVVVDSSSEDYQEAFHALLEVIAENNDTHTDNNHHHPSTSTSSSSTTKNNRIVGLYGKLDYSPEMTDMIGYDRTTQLNKIRVTCQVAIQCQLPIQIKIHPSAVPSTINTTNTTTTTTTTTTTDDDDDNDNNNNSNQVELDETVLQQAEAYKQVVKDLARVLLEMTPPTTTTTTTTAGGGDGDGDGTNNIDTMSLPLRVHLSSWSGTELHMNHLLQAFPHNLYIGLNATIGYTKHKHLHECTFAIPINRCIIESDAPNAIPSQLHNKKKIFCHSGCILYTAVSIAEHKRHTISPMEVLRTTTQNTLHLYGSRNTVSCSSSSSSSSSGDDGDNGSSSNPPIKNELARRIEDVIRQTKEQRKERFDIQQQQQQDADAERNDDGRLDHNGTSGTIASTKLTKKKSKTKRNNMNQNHTVNTDDDELLAELVNEMMTDNPDPTKI